MTLYAYNYFWNKTRHTQQLNDWFAKLVSSNEGVTGKDIDFVASAYTPPLSCHVALGKLLDLSRLGILRWALAPQLIPGAYLFKLTHAAQC